MAIDIERLARPEEEGRDEIGAGYEGDDKREGKDPWVLLETLGEHGVFGTFDLPDQENDDEEYAEKEWYEYMCGFPWILFHP